MTLYRVTFVTEMLVEADTEAEAEKIGDDFLDQEVNNKNSSYIHSVEELTHINQLQRDEHHSLPWRSRNRRKEIEKTVNQILCQAE